MLSISVVIFICLFVSPCLGQTGDNVKNLLTQLFTTNGYKKNVRPNLDQTKPMDVFLSLALVGINGIDEKTQKLTATGYAYIEWEDEYLKWDPIAHGNVTYIYVSQNDIWKPDIALQNGFTKLQELGNSFIHAIIWYSGYVVWLPSEILETKCSINIKHFPFDQQTCDIVFVVWSTGISDVNVTKGSKGILLDDLDKNGVWSVVSTTAKEDVEDSESRVIFQITLKRSSNYYVLNVIVPVVLLGVLNVFTFALPAESGEKMGYSITVFLSFAVFLTIVSAELPKTSGSILGYYLMFQLGMGTFVVAVSALELRLHHRKSPVPPPILKMFRCRKKSISNSSDNSFESVRKETDSKYSWKHIIAAADCVLFWSTLLTEMIVTVAIFGTLSSTYN